MRLNPDCVRAILLTVEEHSDGISDKKYDVSPDFPLLNEYPFDVFLYNVRQCKQNGYFTQCKQDVLGDIYIEDLSPAGHEFLAHIRDDKNWKRILALSLNAAPTEFLPLISICES